MINFKECPKDLSKEFQFIFLGNTSFSGLLQREHAFALELARRGYKVTFVEGMPSLGLKIKERLYSFLFNYNMPSQKNINLTDITVAVPPLAPTFFRSSYTPKIDAKIFSKWFYKKFSNLDWSKVIITATFPYWWNGFINRKKYPVRFIVYDICDSLEVHSRDKRTLIRMINAEEALMRESDLITFSAYELQNKFSQDYFSRAACIPNAVSDKFFEEVRNLDNLKSNGGDSFKNKIGFIGALDGRWIDLELIKKTVSKFPEYTFAFVSPFRRKFFNALSKYKNVELLGFKCREDIPAILNDFKVAIIPFLKNAITDFVNPLKLYEYCAAGIPILATRTRELEHYSEIVHLADNHEDFLNILSRILNGSGDEKKYERIQFARENTWQKRVDLLLNLINQKMLSS